jgi:hypothetical protein
MNWSRMSVYLLVICLLALPVAAQDTPSVDTIDNNEWRVYAAGEVRLSVPPGWQPDRSGTRFSADNDEAALIINLFEADPDSTLQDLTERSLRRIDATRGGDVIETRRVMLPVAEASRIDYTVDALNGVERRVRYLVLLDETHIELNGLARADLNADELDTYLTTFRQAANTLSAGQADSWTRYGDPVISAQVPDDWNRRDVPDTPLAFSSSDRAAFMAFTVRDLGATVAIEDLEDQILSVYDAQRGDVVAYEYVNLPAGDALRLHRENVVFTPGSDEVHTQVDYVLVRDNYLLLINSGVSQQSYDTYRARLERIMDTVVFMPEAETAVSGSRG